MYRHCSLPVFAPHFGHLIPGREFLNAWISLNGTATGA